MTEPSADERPLADCLADFWQGTFPLRLAERPDVAGPAAGPGFPSTLGPSGITAHGRDLATHLVPLYRRLTSTDYGAGRAPC